MEEQKVITLTYELFDGGPEGELLERMDARYPFVFLFGTGKLLPAFEENLRGLTADASFSFVLLPDEAYGRFNALNVLKLSIDDFRRASGVPDDYLEPGNLVNVTDDGGLRHNGKILEVTADYVKVDFNHAMVGKTLHFKGSVLHIRDATLNELIRGHYIEPSGI